MNPPDDSPLESLIRRRADRLVSPDPAWRDAILAACDAAAATESRPAPDRPVKHRLTPLRVSAWGALAACWTAVLLLNQDARQLNAGVALPSSPPTAAAFPHDAVFLYAHDVAALTWPRPVRKPHPAPPSSHAPKPPHHQSSRFLLKSALRLSA